MNEFLKYKRKVSNAKAKYLAAKEHDSHPGNKEIINKLSRPFERDHFTLAVIGGMSAGKSSFLNAFLGEKNLLPTGGDQTTCSLTSICYSKRQSVTIKYSNGEAQSFQAKDINELKSILNDKVAIPREFGNGFPILQINNDIVQGLSKEQILGKLSEYETLAQRPIKADLEKYLSLKMDDSKFVEEVSIGMDVKSLEGWRIVDTPGVCALGGIEEITRDFIFKKDDDGYDLVDAVLFIYNGSESLQKNPALTGFIKDVAKRKQTIIAERSFMIITHSASGFFQDCGDYVENAKQQIEGIIPDERIFYVDNNLELFCKAREKDYRDFKDLITKDYLTNWPKDTAAILKEMKSDLLDDHNSLCNEDFIQKINELSQFAALRENLEQFIVQRKQQVYAEIINLIKSDLKNLAARKKEDMAMVKKDLTGQQDMADQLQQKKEERKFQKEKYNEIANQLRNKFSESEIRKKYDDIRKRTRDLSKLHSIELIDQETDSIHDELVTLRTTIPNDLAEECKHQFESIPKKFSFPTVDFKSIVTTAKNKKDNIEEKIVNKSGLGNFLKRLFTKKSSLKGRELVKETKPEKVAEDCKNEILKVIGEDIEAAKLGVEGFLKSADSQIDKTQQQIDADECALVEKTKTIEGKQQAIKQLDAIIQQIECSLVEIDNLTGDEN